MALNGETTVLDLELPRATLRVSIALNLVLTRYIKAGREI